MCAAKHASVLLKSVTNNGHVAVFTMRRYHLDGALETVKRIRLALDLQLKGFIVIIAASVTNWHGMSPEKLAHAALNCFLRTGSVMSCVAIAIPSRLGR